MGATSTGPTEALRYRRCRACDHAQVGSGPFCRRCGAADLQEAVAGGGGRVASLTTVHRAPSEAFRAWVPYTLLLVDADEGFRVLARARDARGLAIGARVRLWRGEGGLTEAEGAT